MNNQTNKDTTLPAVSSGGFSVSAQGDNERTREQVDGSLSEEAIEQAARMLKAMAHPLRLRIVELLERSEMTVGRLMQALGSKPAVTSQHLTMMRDRGLLKSRRDGNRIYYSLKDADVAGILQCIRRHCEPGRR